MLKLQQLFFRKLLSDDTESSCLHMPGQGVAIPDFFELKCSNDSAAIDDNVSMSLSIASAQDERDMAKQDAISVSSGISGHFAAGPGIIPHSNSNMNLSDLEADEEDNPEPESIYEDISEICERLEDAEESSASQRDAAKKSSILSFLKDRVKKGKKGKEKVTDPVSAKPEVITSPEADLEFREEDEDAIEETAEAESEESYDEMKPGNTDAYLSDNYEDIGFDQPQDTTPTRSKQEPVVPDVQLPPDILKGKKILLQKPSIKMKNKIPTTTDSLASEIEDKKAKMKEKMGQRFASATLPRKFKSDIAAAAEKPTEKALGLAVNIATRAQSATTGATGLEQEVSELRDEVESLKSQLASLTSTVEMLLSERDGVGMSSGEGGTEEDNLRMLKKLTLDQV